MEVIRNNMIEVALCERCGRYTEWNRRGSHPWHHRRCIWCGSERVSRCETERETKKEINQ